MAEQTILVCDECGKPAVETATIKVARGNFVKDLCATHVTALVAGARKPRPGRRRGVVAGTGSAGGSGATRSTGKRSTGKRLTGTRTTGKRRGRPPKVTT
jgi:hypothetical protein